MIRRWVQRRRLAAAMRRDLARIPCGCLRPDCREWQEATP